MEEKQAGHEESCQYMGWGDCVNALEEKTWKKSTSRRHGVWKGREGKWVWGGCSV